MNTQSADPDLTMTDQLSDEHTQKVKQTYQSSKACEKYIRVNDEIDEHIKEFILVFWAKKPDPMKTLMSIQEAKDLLQRHRERFYH